jgi:hypothetical protein
MWNDRQIAVEETNYNANNILHVPYLGLYNAQDFAQILYFVGGVRIINRNNVFNWCFHMMKYLTLHVDNSKQKNIADM